jgi:hypothetical protein
MVFVSRFNGRSLDPRRASANPPPTTTIAVPPRRTKFGPGAGCTSTSASCSAPSEVSVSTSICRPSAGEADASAVQPSRTTVPTTARASARTLTPYPPREQRARTVVLQASPWPLPRTPSTVRTPTGRSFSPRRPAFTPAPPNRLTPGTTRRRGVRVHGGSPTL